MEKKEKTQTLKIRNESGDIPIKPGETKQIITESYGQLYANKLDSLQEMEES